MPALYVSHLTPKYIPKTNAHTLPPNFVHKYVHISIIRNSPQTSHDASDQNIISCNEMEESQKQKVE